MKSLASSIHISLIFPILLTLLVFMSDYSFRIGSSQFISFPEILVAFFILFGIFGVVIKGSFTVSKAGLRISSSIFAIFVFATIGALSNLQNINLNEHVFSALRVIFWIFFFLSWDIHIHRFRVASRISSNRVWKAYLIAGLVVSILAIFQYSFYLIAGRHLNLSPLFEQGWGVFGGYYRATSIFPEPAHFGAAIAPIFFAQFRIFLNEGNFKHLLSSFVLLLGIAVSLSLGTFLVVGVWGFWMLLKWFYSGLKVFLRPRTRISMRDLKVSGLLVLLLSFGVVVFFVWLVPLLIPRLTYEAGQLAGYVEGNVPFSSGVGRFSGYAGFSEVLKVSPLFGLGFDQTEYISSLMGKFFRADLGSGIFGFVGTSAGVLGVVAAFYIFWLVWKGTRSDKLRMGFFSRPFPPLLVAGRGIVEALLLTQLMLSGGFLRPNFWIPLALAYLFIKSGYKSMKEEKVYAEKT